MLPQRYTEGKLGLKTTMPDELNEILNEAIPQWAMLTGTKLGTQTFTFSFGGSSEFQDYDLKKHLDDLNDARKFDTSGTTAILLLRGLFEAYAKERAFKIHALLYAPEKTEATLSHLRAFHALITRGACTRPVSEFRDVVRAAAVHYGYDLKKLKAIIADERALGALRLAAARSRDSLDVHQFSQGAPGSQPLQYNRAIFEFSNINSFIAALHQQKVAGATLALVRDVDDERSIYKAFFALGLKSGENLTILTDYSEGPHPEYHNMTRRPERQLDQRARAHWFPYGLLDEDPVKRAKRKHALVAKDAKPIPVAEISALEPSEFIWLTLLFEFLAEKYGGNFKTEELSYTGEMVVEPQALLASEHSLVLSGRYKTLVLPKLTPEIATPEAADNKVPVGHNAWMEDRYRHRVPEILLNVVGERKALEVGKQVTRLLPGAAEVSELPTLRRQPGVFGWGPDYRKTPLNPKALDPTSFGTKNQISRNRTWTARINMMQTIQRFAVDDFAKKHALVLRWYRERVARNMPFIWRAVAHGELAAPVMSWKSKVERDCPFPCHDTPVWREDNILEQRLDKGWRSLSTGGIQIGAWDKRRHLITCGRDPSRRAGIFTLIQPNNPRALALLCGVSMGKLPWPLQHWSTSEPYTGNSILARIDPQDALLDNPWRHLELQISVALCKREFARLRKEHGLRETHGIAEGLSHG